MSNLQTDKSDVDYMHDYVKKLGSFTRSPGSDGERKGAEMTAEMMKEYSDEVEMEEFSLAPKAALGWIKLVIPIFFVALFTFHAVPILSALLMIFIIFIFLGQFVFYKKIVDPFMPKKTSQNTYGVINPSGEPRQTVIFSGHLDSPYQFNFIKWWGGSFYVILMVLVIATLIFFSVTTISNGISYLTDYFNSTAAAGEVSPELNVRWLASLYLSPLALLFFFFTTWVETPGCGDNLSGVSVAMGVGRFLQKAKQGQEDKYFPRHTRVITMAFGAEEAFLRGAMAYVKKHGEQLKKENTTVINLETLVGTEKLFVLTRDLNSTVKMSSRAVNDVIKASEEKGINIKKMILPFGGGSTDSAAVAKAGIDTTCILGIDLGKIIQGKGYFNHYHTVRDTPDKVPPEALQQALDVCLQYLKNKDEEVSEKHI